MKTPRLVIVGRPNVGKSTLFNRLLGRRRALVHDEPGVTRDRLEERAKWIVNGHDFPILLVDTGGLGGERFAEEIQRQVETALTRADVVIALFDAQTGLTPQDEEILRKLNQAGFFKRKEGGEEKRIPVIGVVNKVDAEKHEELLAEFYASGLDPILTVSAEHGRGIDDLQHEIARQLGDDSGASEELELGTNDLDPETQTEKNPTNRIPRIAIVGRPNAGKSTLVNALIREDRMVTSPIAGTTVDSVDTLAELNGKPFVLIDTAGIRRKSKTEQGIEVLSVVQTRKALERCDVAILLMDGEGGITDQDEKIGGLIEEVGCGVILMLNKWDTQRRNPGFTQEMAADRIRGQMAYLRYAPILFASALRKEGLQDLGDLVQEILDQRQLKVSTNDISEWVRETVLAQNHQNAKFFLCHQAGRNPPTFVFHVSDPDRVHFSLRRHLSNGLRQRWGFMGSPIRLLFVAGKNRKSMRKVSKTKATARGRVKAAKKRSTTPKK